MPDTLSQELRHKAMAAIHSASTKPELKLRLVLWHLGFRYRVNCKRLPGSPDIVLPKYRTAIFIHGCFWHGHKGCKYYTVPKTNTDFWIAKVARNQERDQKVWRELEAMGWSVIIVWECALKKAVFGNTIERVVAEIRSNGEKHQAEKECRRSSRKEYLSNRKALKEREETLLKEAKSFLR